jgi:hypothetical protein
MSGPHLFATLPRHSINKPCDTCGEPITLRKTPGGQWVPFDADPVVLKTVQEGQSLIRGGRVLEMLDAADRHQCRRDGG